MKKETKKPNVPTFKEVLEFKPECFIDPIREVETLDGQALKLLKNEALMETDAKSEFKSKRDALKKVMARLAAKPEGLTLGSVFDLRLKFMEYQLRITDGSNTRSWTIKGAQMVFDSVVSQALYRTALTVDDTVAMEWDKQLKALNNEHGILLAPQQRENGQYMPVLMVSLSEPEIDSDDIGIFGEEYPEGTGDAWMFRS
jgi:hypothetical protein